MHETIRKAYLSLLPLPLCVCARTRDQDRESVLWRERVCLVFVQFPRGCHCRIYPFPPSELDLTRLHNICMGAAEFMYTAEGVCLRKAGACVCLGALISVLDYLF